MLFRSFVIAQDFIYPRGQNLVEYVEAENFISYEIIINTPVAEGITYQYQLVGNTFNSNNCAILHHKILPMVANEMFCNISFIFRVLWG